MSYHSRNNSEFVGLRLAIGGQRQVVYDAVSGKRILLEIQDTDASEDEINEALQEGINSRNVLGGVLAALKARNITVDFTP